MSLDSGRTFITEYAKRPGVSRYDPPLTTAAGQVQSLATLYYDTCAGPDPTGDEFDSGLVSPPACVEAGTNMSMSDAGIDDASSDDGAADDASADDAGSDDAGNPVDIDASPDEAGTNASGDAGSCTMTGGNAGGSWDGTCASRDDLVVAIDGMDPSNVWVTRLRSELPVGALVSDLKLQASASQTEYDNVHQAKDPNAPAAASIAPPRSGMAAGAGSVIMTLATMAWVGAQLRRRRRDRDARS
jgi:hypothetical protein